MKESTERFSDRVDNYVKYRPGYPKEFIDFLYAKTGLTEDSGIADIGSDTGILTARLLSSSYAPLPGENHYEPTTRGLRELFDKFRIKNTISFGYETEVYIGEV